MAGGHPKPKKSKQMSDLETRIRNSNMEPRINKNKLNGLKISLKFLSRSIRLFQYVKQIQLKKYKTSLLTSNRPLTKRYMEWNLLKKRS
jgi:hypothetical protein